MPFYEYLCDSCGRFESLQRGDNAPCPNCGLHARRKFGFRPQRSPFAAGYNPSAGKYIGSMGELKSEFAKESERQSIERGMEVDIQPVDMSDRAACGISDADVDRMAKERRDAGVPT